jgi:hypothetical protein
LRRQPNSSFDKFKRTFSIAPAGNAIFCYGTSGIAGHARPFAHPTPTSRPSNTAFKFSSCSALPLARGKPRQEPLMSLERSDARIEAKSIGNMNRHRQRETPRTGLIQARYQ